MSSETNHESPPLHTEDIFILSHGVSRNITEISKQDYNFDNFSVTISDSPCEERKSVILRDHPCEKKKTVTVRDSPCEKKRDHPCEKKISINK